jgi:diacylglycerol kinase
MSVNAAKAILLALLMRPLSKLTEALLAWRLEKQDTQPAYRSFVQSFSFALAGVRFALCNEPNMRIHMCVAALAIIAGAWFEIDKSDWRWLIFAIAMVLVAEAFNTAIEQCCNAVSREYIPAIKAAKDVAAGAVLIAAACAALIGASIFLPLVKCLAWPNQLSLTETICSQAASKSMKCDQ